jgi:hypothetical protein
LKVAGLLNIVKVGEFAGFAMCTVMDGIALGGLVGVHFGKRNVGFLE